MVRALCVSAFVLYAAPAFGGFIYSFQQRDLFAQIMFGRVLDGVGDSASDFLPYNRTVTKSSVVDGVGAIASASQNSQFSDLLVQERKYDEPR